MLYIRPDVYALADTSDVAKLRQAVQVAIELEHSTMPPYLYALYSLGTSNTYIRTSLRAIVIEEMLHMLLVCNLLNALGQKPKIDDPTFVPNYPAPLPGTLANGLIVPLSCFSKEFAEGVLMIIEEPENPLEFPLGMEEPGPRTIGQFYERIRDQVQALGAAVLTGDPARQVTSPWFDMPEDEQKITDPTSAVRAINYIVEQGEGTKESPKFGPTDKLAHYYRLAEIVKGKRLIPSPNWIPSTPPVQGYLYGGLAIDIDTANIRPLRKNPKSAQYPAGPIRQKSDECNRIYTRILGLLQMAFDGDPGQLNTAIVMMTDELKPAVLDLTTKDLGDGSHAGPTFEYLR